MYIFLSTLSANLCGGRGEAAGKEDLNSSLLLASAAGEAARELMLPRRGEGMPGGLPSPTQGGLPGSQATASVTRNLGGPSPRAGDRIGDFKVWSPSPALGLEVGRLRAADLDWSPSLLAGQSYSPGCNFLCKQPRGGGAIPELAAPTGRSPRAHFLQLPPPTPGIVSDLCLLLGVLGEKGTGAAISSLSPLLPRLPLFSAQSPGTNSKGSPRWQ